MEQAWDGRVRVQFATNEAEDEFAHQFSSDKAKRDGRKPGGWVDLSRHSYYFPEMRSSFSEGRDRRRRKDARCVPGLFGQTSSSPSVKTTSTLPTSQQSVVARKHGKEYSSDYTGDGPSSSSGSAMINGVELSKPRSLAVWKDFYENA